MIANNEKYMSGYYAFVTRTIATFKKLVIVYKDNYIDIYCVDGNNDNNANLLTKKYTNVPGNRLKATYYS